MDGTPFFQFCRCPEDGARNAGILAAQILGATDNSLAQRLDIFKDSLKNKVEFVAKNIESKGWKDL
jgi:5-(carboxyamino)imidazole ribonucleotide mutase